MTLKHLQIFATVCREGSITKAAQTMFMSQPAVSLAIRELESYYNVKLFDRISHKLYLTAPGKLALDYTENILHQYEELGHVLMQQTAKEKLLIGNSIGSAIFTALMKGFSDRYSNVETNVISDHTSTITKKVINNECDVATIEGVATVPELTSIIFANEVMIAFAAPDHPLAHKKGLILSDLSEERFLLREKFSGARTVIDNVFLSHDMNIKPYWESSASLVILDAVRLGIGISILPYSLVLPDIKTGTLVALDIEDAVFTYPYSIIYRKNKYKTHAFIDFCNYFQTEAVKIKYEENLT